MTTSLSELPLKLLPFAKTAARVPCPKCGKTRKWFCYDCCIQLPSSPESKEADAVPPFTLPLQIDIVHHPGETRSKSSAMHAVVLCPTQVLLHEFPQVPEFDPTNTVLLFPDPDAKPVSEVDVSQFSRAVFIDSTWSQATKVRSHPALKGLPCVKIGQYDSVFWRYQSDQPKTSLATIEAIYFFCREYQQRLAPEKPYAGEFDNLLYYFMGQYSMIQKSYSDSNKTFTTMHYEGYIKGQPDQTQGQPEPLQEGKGTQEHSTKRKRTEEEPEAQPLDNVAKTIH